MIYKGEEIYNIIPNRKPLMVLDYIDVIDEENAEGGLTYEKDTWYYECHYPQNHIFPICLIVESMAQVFSAIFFRRYNEIPVVYSMGPIKMSDKILCGESVIFRAKLEKEKRGVLSGKCSTYKKIDNKEVLIAEMEITDVIRTKMVVKK